MVRCNGRNTRLRGSPPKKTEIREGCYTLSDPVEHIVLHHYTVFNTDAYGDRDLAIHYPLGRQSCY